MWTDYVERMVQEKGNATTYPLSLTCSRLGFLARQLRAHQQSTFYAEHLHLDWLPGTQEPLVTRLTVLLPSLVIGLCTSFFAVTLVEGYAYYARVLLQMAVLGGFIGVWLSSSVAERPVENRKHWTKRMVRYLRNAVVLGIAIAISVGLSLDSGYQTSDRLRNSCILGLGYLLSSWVFLALVDRAPGPRVPVPHKRSGQSGHPPAWASSLGLPFWPAGGILGIGTGLSYWLTYGSSIGLGPGLSTAITVIWIRIILDASLKTPRFAERIHWNWRSLILPEHFRTTLIVITITFLIFIPGYGLSIVLGTASNGLNILVIAPGIGLIYWVLSGLYQGMKQEQIEDQNRSQFNQGIWRSLRNGLLLSLISASIITTVGELGLVGIALSSEMDPSIASGIVPGYTLIVAHTWPGLLVAGIVTMWALFGGPTVLRHYVIRWLLARSQLLPFRISTFLDDATTRILLRRVGGGYCFVHRRLQDYLADATTSFSAEGSTSVQR
ncbi:MAG TPA: hypothetical protein VGF67_17625 [Ktedonobacteraceae bacterium]